MTDEEIIERGLAAAELLQNDTFNSLVEELSDESIALWVNSESGEQDVQKQAHDDLKALKRLMAELLSRVQQQEDTEARLKAEEILEDA